MPTREEKIAFIQSQMGGQMPADTGASSDLSREQKIAFIQSKMNTDQPQESMGRQLVRSAVDTVLPYGSMIAAGAMATPETGGLGTVPAAAAGYAGGKQLARVVNSYLLGDDSGAKTPVDLAKQTAGDYLSGATQEMGGKVLSEGAGLVLDKAGKLIPAAKALAVTDKAAAPEIAAAAERAGIKATPGMLKNSEAIQGLESSLSQSPSIAGALVRKNTGKVLDAIDAAPKAALQDATGLTPYQVGETAKAGIEKAVGERADKTAAVFNDLRESTQNIALDPKSLSRVGNNINNMKDVALTPGSTWSNKASQYADWLQNAQSVDDIKKLRTLVGNELDSAEGPERYVLGSIKTRLTRLEENSMLRGTINTMRSFARSADGKTGDAMAAQGEGVAQDMIGQMRGARKDWAGLMSDLRDLSDNARLGKIDNPSQFIDKVNAIPSEKLGDRLFNVNDQRLLDSVKTQFPKEFDLLRQNQLASIAKRSSDANGELSTQKFFNNIKNLTPDQQSMLFGQEIKTIDDAKVLRSALPEKIGPSGTPQGEMFKQSHSPIFQATEMARYGLYKGLSSKPAQAISDMLLEKPEMAALAKSNPDKFKAVVISLNKTFGDQPQQAASVSAPARAADKNDQPLKGKDKWANDGLQNLKDHVDDESTQKQLDDAKETLLKDPKAQSLLIAASDLKPGTKAMDRVLAQVKSKLPKDGK
jgi:hypothetical protein